MSYVINFWILWLFLCKIDGRLHTCKRSAFGRFDTSKPQVSARIG